MPGRPPVNTQPIQIPIDERDVALDGDLALPEPCRGVVVFAHGSGSSRHSPRNRAVAASLQQAGFATVLMDLLSADEEAIDRHTAHLRFDIELLARRLAAAALVAAANDPRVRAVVSRGGRPDLAGSRLPEVAAPTLLIVGGADGSVIALNQQALRAMRCVKELAIVPGATHLFEEPGALERVMTLALRWFERHL